MSNVILFFVICASLFAFPIQTGSVPHDPSVMSDWVEHPRYVQYYRALLYHGDYVAWNEGDTWYFMRDGKKCVFYKEDE